MRFSQEDKAKLVRVYLGDRPGTRREWIASLRATNPGEHRLLRTLSTADESDISELTYKFCEAFQVAIDDNYCSMEGSMIDGIDTEEAA